MTLTKQVIGFYPDLWISNKSEYLNLHPDLLTVICYFDVQLKSDGTLNIRSTWPNTNMVNWCHSNGLKVVLGVGSSSKSIEDTIFASSTLQDTLATNILNAIQYANMDGVNIDIESMNVTNSVNGQPNRGLLTQLVHKISTMLKTTNPSYHTSIDLPDDINPNFDISSMIPDIDYFMVMGYEIWIPNTAGPTAPMNAATNCGGGYCTDVTKGINNWLTLIPKEKLIMLVPYYGYDYITGSCNKGAAITGIRTLYYYTTFVTGLGTNTRIFDTEWKTPRYCFKDTSNKYHQRHYDDVESLGYKYDFALQQDLAGIGMWALGFDDVRTELWDLIRNKFSTIVPILTSIQLGLSILVGGTKKLTVKCIDENNNPMTCPVLTWASSNISIATVSPTGVVKGISKGTVNITTSSSDIVSNIFVITVT